MNKLSKYKTITRRTMSWTCMILNKPLDFSLAGNVNFNTSISSESRFAPLLPIRILFISNLSSSVLFNFGAFDGAHWSEDKSSLWHISVSLKLKCALGYLTASMMELLEVATKGGALMAQLSHQNLPAH